MIVFICIYVALGIMANIVENALVAVNSKRWFGVEIKFAFGFKRLSMLGWIRKIFNILTWPFGIVAFTLGIRSARKLKLSPEEFESIVLSATKPYFTE